MHEISPLVKNMEINEQSPSKKSRKNWAREHTFLISIE